VLLVISRPDGGADVGYWSVAYGLWRALAALPSVNVDVLRPPTFDALTQTLDRARYAAVHFDGHGAVVDPFGGDHTRGYLLFETPGRGEPEFIDGSTLGRALAGAGVRLFSMNACRSGDSEGGDRHLRVGTRELVAGQPSIVDDVLAAGVPSCVGMRREIYAGTAVRFFVAFYPEFLRGAGAGEAARAARRLLRGDPLSPGVFRAGTESVDDWSIPVVGECSVVRLATADGSGGTGEAQPYPARLCAPAAVGFDRAVLTLEDALVQAPAVLVTGPLLSGKSRLAVEYARWLSATSPAPVAVTFVGLRADIGPDAVAAALGGDVEQLVARGGIVIFDQADRLSSQTEAFLAGLVPQLAGACRVVATARAERLSWLGDVPTVRPDALFRGGRAELALSWARMRGVELDLDAFWPLLFHSGGLPGVLLTLLGVCYDAIASGGMDARDISMWLHTADWDNLRRLTADPGGGLEPLDALVSGVTAGLVSACSATELAMIRAFAEFQVCCGESAADRVWTLVSGTPAPTGASAGAISQLVAAGLATPIPGAAEPSWFLHSLLKLVAPRLPALAVGGDELAGAVVDAVVLTCTNALGRSRSDIDGSHDTLASNRQNMSDALWTALERRDQAAAAVLCEAMCVLCRFDADTDLAGRVLDKALPMFFDTETGHLRPECLQIARGVCEQAFWLSPDWPRNPERFQSRMRLYPVDDDHYAAGIWLRALGDSRRAAVAFRMALDMPQAQRRWAAGDVECQLSETVYQPGDPATWPDALQWARASYTARLVDDSFGRAWSRISEARLRMVMALDPAAEAAGQDVTARVEIGPAQLAALDEAAELLREADGEVGVRSAENRAQAAMVWSRIMLARGDLTAATSYFENGAQVMIDQQEASIWSHYMNFAVNLLRHGWVARSHDAAINAFQFAMQTGDYQLPTRIRQFCEELEATYPELVNE
jgi:hypothetical protein